MDLTMELIDESICGASIEVSALRDVYENVLEEYFKLANKVLTDEETERINQLELQRKKIENYIYGIKEEFVSMCLRIYSESIKKKNTN